MLPFAVLVVRSEGPAAGLPGSVPVRSPLFPAKCRRLIATPRGTGPAAWPIDQEMCVEGTRGTSQGGRSPGDASSLSLRGPKSFMLAEVQAKTSILSSCSSHLQIPAKKPSFHLKCVWGLPGGARSVKRLTLDFGLSHDLKVCGLEPHIRLCADSTEPAWASLSASLSLKIN